MLPLNQKDFRETMLMLSRLVHPPERMSAWEWADKYRILPKSAAESGRWRTDRTPWLRDILSAVDNPKYDTVVIWTASQVGKTEGILNYIGARMHLNPIPMGFFLPDENTARDISQDRVKPMMRDTPELWSGTAKGQAFQNLKMTINGCKLYMLSARSAAQMASRPMGIVFIDEYSRISAHKEGDVRDIVGARGNSFSGFKCFVASTPVEGEAERHYCTETKLTYWEFPGEIPDPTVTLWRTGTRMEWAIPCKHCGKYFIPDLSCLLIPQLENIEEASLNARIKCPFCGGLMNEGDKFTANSAGRFVNGKYQSVTAAGEVIGEVPANSVASFWVPGLVSMFPGGTIAKRAKKLLEARSAAFKDQESKEKAVLNVQFGQLWAPAGRGTEAETIEQLISDYPVGFVPQEVAVLTMGVDCSADRLWYVIRGWGHGADMGSWLIEAGVIFGDMIPVNKSSEEMLPIWKRLNEKLSANYDGMYISSCAIDSGFFTQEVYNFCEYLDESGVVFPIKGDDKLEGILYRPSKIHYNQRGKPSNNVILWRLNTDGLKRWIHKRYQRPAGTFGAFNIPRYAPTEYFKHLVSEKRVLDKQKNRFYWRATGDNHWFDAEVYALSAAFKINAAAMEPAERVLEKKTAAQNKAGGWINQQEKWL